MVPHAIRQRSAFTLIEILVVLAVIGLLVTLIIPAVQRARESARRAQCMNNLKQIGVAMANHESQIGAFPSGAMPNPGGETVSSRTLSAQLQLLPYLEQEALYQSLNLELLQRPSEGFMNETAVQTVVGVFLCPSDPSGASPGNSYRACVGATLHDVESEGRPGGGVFSLIRAKRVSEISDGLSQTAGFSERLRGSGRDHRFDSRRDFWYSGIANSGRQPTLDGGRDACSVLRSAPPEHWPLNGRWWSDGRFADTLYNHVAPPNWLHPDCSMTRPFGIPGDMATGVMSARSPHPGGVHVLFMDGSTRFVRDGVDPALWRAMATRAGGESIVERP
ncbi:DUF1559 domain-containing protein [Tautonia sp. JC769]|uniref:DUF1559 domain-containing protein n=1 Tax=Tautonia sp. JC769 TaxID=3232135 RepID=UPI003459C702